MKELNLKDKVAVITGGAGGRALKNSPVGCVSEGAGLQGSSHVQGSGFRVVDKVNPCNSV